MDRSDEMAALHRLAEQIRASGVLGRARLLKLFDFLIRCAAEGTVPKEIVIAEEVFMKTSAFDISQDSIVRVYIYNLRRKLHQFYLGPGNGEPLQLSLPKGEYRLMVVPNNPPTDLREAVTAPRRRSSLARFAVGVAIIILTVLVTLDLLHRPQDPWVSVRNSPIWADLLQNDKSIVVVLGDYYIFGDTENTPEVTRLIREFSVNSKDDLQQYLQMNPKFADQYLDVGLGYLPTSTGAALADIMPVLATVDRRRVRVVLMSSLDPGTIKSANIVYVGLLSGLGTLKNVVFGSSRFQIGDSYDELIDKKTNIHYFSGANPYAGEHRALNNEIGYRDYGLFSTFAGPEGNRFIIIAGTQDEGVRQMAEAMTDRSTLDALARDAKTHANFEALFEVLSLDNLNLKGKLLLCSPLNSSDIWNSR